MRNKMLQFDSIKLKRNENKRHILLIKKNSTLWYLLFGLT